MRDFRILWVSQTISELGTRMSTFVFPLLGYALTGSSALAALVEAAYLLGMAGLMLPAGVLADRVDRRLIMRTASAAGVVLYASLAAAAALGRLSLTHLLVVAVLSGAAAGVFSPAEISAVRRVVPTEALPSALSQNQARQHVAGLVGAPVGGVLYAVGRWVPFAADTLTYAISWLLLGRITTDLSAPSRERRPVLAELREGASFVWRHPLFRVLTGWACLTNLSMNALFTLAVLRMVGEGVDPWHIGLVETAAATAGIGGALIAPWVIGRVPTGWLTIAIAWSPLPLAVPMALWPHPVVIGAALALVLVLNPAGNAGIGSYRLAVTPAELVGRVQSASQFVSMSSLPLAPVVAGLLLGGLGGQTGMLTAGVLCGLVAAIPTLSRVVRAVPRPDRWATTPPLPEASRLAA